MVTFTWTHHGLVQLKNGAGLPIPNPRHDSDPIGWAVPRIERRDAVLAELVDFVLLLTPGLGR
jgi:hypothetical protein